MSGVVMVPAGADYSGITGMGRFDPIVPSFDGACYASYFLGSGTGRSDLFDWSNNGRKLTRAGAPILSAWHAGIRYAASAANYYEAPFSLNDLVGGGNGATICAVVRAAASDLGFWIASGYEAPDNDYFGVCTRSVSPNAAFRAIHDRGDVTGVAEFDADAHYGTGWEFVAGVASATDVKAYRNYAGLGTMQTDVDTAPVAIPPGAKLFRIGAAHGTAHLAMDDDGEIAAVSFFRGALTAEQIADVYDAYTAWFATRGIALAE